MKSLFVYIAFILSFSAQASLTGLWKGDIKLYEDGEHWDTEELMLEIVRTANSITVSVKQSEVSLYPIACFFENNSVQSCRYIGSDFGYNYQTFSNDKSKLHFQTLDGDAVITMLLEVNSENRLIMNLKIHYPGGSTEILDGELLKI